MSIILAGFTGAIIMAIIFYIGLSHNIDKEVDEMINTIKRVEDLGELELNRKILKRFLQIKDKIEKLEDYLGVEYYDILLPEERKTGYFKKEVNKKGVRKTKTNKKHVT